MKFERIKAPSHPLYAEAIRLYQSSFPPHEQRESSSQAEILRDARYHFDVVCEDGAFVGEILYWDIGDFLYIEHFCVLPAMRNRHYGQRILAALQENHALILEIDPPTDEIARRRKGFYVRCGFAENPYPHVHPPYHAGIAGHDLVVMSSPRVLTPAEYEAFRQVLCGTVMAHAW